MEEIVKLSDEFILKYKDSMPSDIAERYAMYLDKKEAPKELITAYYNFACCKDYKEIMVKEFPFLNP
jgi:hypothetical protein